MRWKSLKNNKERSAEREEKHESVYHEKRDDENSIHLALAIYELAKQIEDNNRLIKTLIQKVELLELKSRNVSNDIALSEIDKKIIEVIKERERITAEELKEMFNYKGKNAASARLNNLCKIGLLKKMHGGKKVYFMLNGNNNHHFYKDM